MLFILNLMAYVFFSLQFNDIVQCYILIGTPFVAGFVAFFLDNTLHRHDNATRKDREYHWWDKFRSFRTDSRSEELTPCCLISSNSSHLCELGAELGSVKAVCIPPSRIPWDVKILAVFISGV